MRISDWSSDVCSSDLISEAIGDGIKTSVGRQAVGSRTDAETGVCISRVPGNRLELSTAGASVQDKGGNIPGANHHVYKIIGDGLGAGGIQSDLAQVRSEEHTSELQSLMRISYAVFCLKKKKTITSK